MKKIRKSTFKTPSCYKERNKSINNVVLFFLLLILLFAVPFAYGEDAPHAGKVVKKMLVLGNSITKHGPAKDLGWTGNWGMAASSEDKDYVHLLYARLCASQAQKPELIICALGGGTIIGKLAANLPAITAHAADLVIIQLGENDHTVTKEGFEEPYEKLIEAAKKANPAARIFCCGTWQGGAARDKMIKNACLRQGAVFVDISAVYANPAASAGSEHRFKHAGVNWHPGDKGMQGYADALWQAMQKQPDLTVAAAQVDKVTPSVAPANKLTDSDVNLVPQPKSVVWRKDVFRLNNDVVIVAAKENVVAAQDLRQELKDVCGIQCPVVSPDESTGKRTITLQVGTLDAKDSTNKEGYTLLAGKDGIIIRSSAAAGVFYGVQTLKQLFQRQGGDMVVRGCEIRDEPVLALRGVYMNLRPTIATPKSMDALKRIIDTFAQLKLNTLFFEIADNMHYDRQSFPQKEKTAFSKAQAKELVAYAKGRHFEVIPTFQMLSHCSWILSNPKNAALLEKPSDRSWNTTWCPSNPAVYDFMKDILDETIEVFQPRYCHVGLDEIGPLGECEKCRKEKPSQLLLKTIMYLHDALAASGIKTIMWQDMLVPASDMYEINKAKGYEIVDQIPKDVIIADWDYGIFNAAAKKRLEYFTQKGFQVLGASFSNPRAIQTLNAGLAANPRAFGHISTHWYEVHDWSEVSTLSPKAWLDQVLGAQYAWNPTTPALENIHYDPVQLIRNMYGPKRPLAENGIWESIPLEQAFNGCISNDANSWPGYGAGNSLNAVFDGSIVCDDVQFLMGSPRDNNVLLMNGGANDGLAGKPVTIPVQRKARRLAFLHACNIPCNIGALAAWQNATAKPPVAKYQINYADGSSVDMPLLYRWNIMDWNSKTGAFEGQIAYAGKTKAGFRIQLLKTDWDNPSPEKIIESIIVSTAANDGMSLALFAVSAQSNDGDEK
jgi:lysophospholipase L1-like esterase